MAVGVGGIKGRRGGHGAAHQLQSLVDIPLQLPCARCRLHAAALANKQRIVEGKTQSLQGGADRGLTHAEGDCGRRQLAGVHQAVEYSQQIQVDGA